MAVALLVFGLLLDITGIVLIGYPDVRPETIRLSAFLRRQGNRLRRLVGIEPRPVIHTISIADEINIEEKVEYLFRRDHEAQREANELAARITDLEAAFPRGRAELREQWMKDIASAIAAEREAYRPLRAAAMFALVFGVICTTIATFLL